MAYVVMEGIIPVSHQSGRLAGTHHCMQAAGGKSMRTDPPPCMIVLTTKTCHCMQATAGKTVRAGSAAGVPQEALPEEVTEPSTGQVRVGAWVRAWVCCVHVCLGVSKRFCGLCCASLVPAPK